MRPEWLKKASLECSFREGETVYDVARVRQLSDELRVLVPGSDGRGYAWLAIKNPTAWMTFAVLRYHSQDPVVASLVFHGEGPATGLRECRHTYWGDDGNGYLFYPSGKLITAAFRELEDFFDEMV